MARIEHIIEVNVPLSAVYNQWTQFEDFPRFMTGVQEVTQLDDAHLHWRAERHGKEMEWDSEITDQVPDQHIAWRDTSGPGNAGSVSFYPVDQSKTRVQLILETDANSSPEDAALAQLTISQRIEQDLVRFKKLLETQGAESGAWRGEIHDSQPVASVSATRNDGARIDAGTQGQSVFAQQTSPDADSTLTIPDANAPLHSQTARNTGEAARPQQTKADADPRTATLDNKVGTAGLGPNSTGGGMQEVPGARTAAAKGSSAEHESTRSPYSASGGLEPDSGSMGGRHNQSNTPAGSNANEERAEQTPAQKKKNTEVLRGGFHGG